MRHILQIFEDALISQTNFRKRRRSDRCHNHPGVQPELEPIHSQSDRRSDRALQAGCRIFKKIKDQMFLFQCANRQSLCESRDSQDSQGDSFNSTPLQIDDEEARNMEGEIQEISPGTLIKKI